MTASYELIEVQETGNSIFSAKEEKKTKFRFTDEAFYWNFYDEINLPFLEIKSSRIIKKYWILHKDLKSVLSLIGGLFSSFILIGNILISLFNQKKFEYDIMNYLFKKDLTVDQIFEVFQKFKIKKYMKEFRNKKNKILSSDIHFNKNPIKNEPPSYEQERELYEIGTSGLTDKFGSEKLDRSNSHSFGVFNTNRSSTNQDKDNNINNKQAFFEQIF